MASARGRRRHGWVERRRREGSCRCVSLLVRCFTRPHTGTAADEERGRRRTHLRVSWHPHRPSHRGRARRPDRRRLRPARGEATAALAVGTAGRASALALGRVGVTDDKWELPRLHRVLAVKGLDGHRARVAVGVAHEGAATLALLLSAREVEGDRVAGVRAGRIPKEDAGARRAARGVHAHVRIMESGAPSERGQAKMREELRPSARAQR